MQKIAFLSLLSLFIQTIQMWSQLPSTSASYRPLNKGDVFIYQHSSFEQGWNNERRGPGVYVRRDYSSRRQGYFFSKIIGDSILAGKRYSIIYTPPNYIDQQNQHYALQNIAFERSAQNSIYRYQDATETEMFNAVTKRYVLYKGLDDCSRTNDNTGATIVCGTNDNTGATIISYYKNIKGGTTIINGSLAPPGDYYDSRAVKFIPGFGLSQENISKSSRDYAFLTSYVLFGESTYQENIQLVGSIINGKIYGDSNIVLGLDTDKNQFRKVKIYVQSSVSANINQTVDIPITLVGYSTAGVKVGTITSNLSLNATLLEPLGNTPMGTVSNGIRRIPLSFQLDSLSDSITVTLRFRATLGNDTATGLTFDTPILPAFAKVQTQVQGGYFKLTGLNYAGGSPTRFFSKKSQLLTLLSDPNPFAEILHLSFLVEKPTQIDLELYSIDGRKIAGMGKFIDNSGICDINWNPADNSISPISNGTYIVYLLIDGRHIARAITVKMN